MPISISCGQCDWKGKVKDEMAGKTGKCPTCGEHIPIPRGSAKAAPPLPAKKSRPPVEDDDEPRRKPKSKISRDEDDDDRPSKRRPVDDDDDEPRPRKKISRDDDEDDEPRPKKKKPSRFDDDDDEPRPRKKLKKKKKPPESINGKKVSAIGFGLLAVLVGGGWLAWMFLGDGRFRFYPLILLLIGLIGMFQGFTGIGLDSDDDDD